jgi:hypothetical protein
VSSASTLKTLPLPPEKMANRDKSGETSYVIFSPFLHFHVVQIYGEVTSERHNDAVMDAVVATMVEGKEIERRNYPPLVRKIGEISWS